MQKIFPFLWFDKNAEEAAEFYVSVFKKNSKILQKARYGDSGPGPKGSIMTVSFRLGDQVFVALNGGPVFKFNEAVSFVIHCKNQKEIDYYWSKLTKGGKAVQCGWLKDKYGVSWQIVPEAIKKYFSGPDPKSGERVMKAMMGMVKLDIKTLDRAFKGK